MRTQSALKWIHHDNWTRVLKLLENSTHQKATMNFWAIHYFTTFMSCFLAFTERQNRKKFFWKLWAKFQRPSPWNKRLKRFDKTMHQRVNRWKLIKTNKTCETFTLWLPVKESMLESAATWFDLKRAKINKLPLITLNWYLITWYQAQWAAEAWPWPAINSR